MEGGDERDVGGGAGRAEATGEGYGRSGHPFYGGYGYGVVCEMWGVGMEVDCLIEESGVDGPH